MDRPTAAAGTSPLRTAPARRRLRSGRHTRLGNAGLAACQAYADSGAFPEILGIYHLFGDLEGRVR